MRKLQRRGLIVFDGDNVEWTARNILYGQKVHFGKLAQMLQARYGITELVDAIVFLSAQSGLKERQRQLSEQGVSSKLFGHVNGRGYPDWTICKHAEGMVDSYDTLVLVSSDSDFRKCVEKLRRRGKTVVGVGAKDNTNAYWQDAYDHFVFLEDAIDMASLGSAALPVA